MNMSAQELVNALLMTLSEQEGKHRLSTPNCLLSWVEQITLA